MTCDSVAKLIPLYYYGELTPEEEDRLDEHLPGCAACAAEMERQRALAAALDRRKIEASPLLLEDCRSDLMMAIGGAGDRLLPSVNPRPSKSAWTLFLEALNVSAAGFGRMRQPLGAVALIFLGFVLARFSGSLPSFTGNVAPADVFSTVRSVKPDSAGRVDITYDETHRREVVGRADDPDIQKLLVAGLRDENAAVRLQSVGLLTNRAGSPQTVDLLLNALEDPVDGIRLRALDALQPLAGDPRVTKALSRVLLTDPNSAMRYKAIDMLVAHRDDSVVGVLQNQAQREDDSNVRQKIFKTLKDWNASFGTF